MFALITPPIKAKYSNCVNDVEYVVIKNGTKFEDCGSVEMEMRNGEVDVKNIKDGKVGPTPDERRRGKKRSEESDNSGNLNIKMDFNKGRNLVGRPRWNGWLEFMSVNICWLQDG